MLLASPSLNGQILSAKNLNLNGYTISELILDGNKSQRGGQPCPHQANMELWGSSFTLHHVDTINAPCGSGLGLLGSGYNVYSVYSSDNGVSADEAIGRWADGMTVLRCENGWIHDNVIRNSTDFGLVIGGGPSCVVENNTIEQADVFAFAGLNLGNFSTGSYWDGRHNDSRIRNNTVTSGYNLLMHGISVGSHAYSSGALVPVFDAGYVEWNTSFGAQINLLVDGIDAGVIAGNSLSSPGGTRTNFNSCGYVGNFTAGHFGAATVQGGFAARTFDFGSCQ